MIQRGAPWLAVMAAVTAPFSTLSAQNEPQATAEEDDRLVIDLTQPTPEAPYDALAAQDCDEEADAARIAGENNV